MSEEIKTQYPYKLKLVNLSKLILKHCIRDGQITFPRTDQGRDIFHLDESHLEKSTGEVDSLGGILTLSCPEGAIAHFPDERCIQAYRLLQKQKQSKDRNWLK